MAKFQLDTSGVVTMNPPEQPAFAHLLFTDLDSFTQGYVEALFFTDGDDLENEEEIRNEDGPLVRASLGFSDLAPETLARIIADCDAFKAATVHIQPLMGEDGFPDETYAGHDFWLTRNGHGAGFWDGDWPEPHATTLDEAAKAAGEVEVYLGDDGKVHLT